MGREGNKLAPGEPFIEREILRQDPHQGLRANRLAPDIHSADPDRAGGRAQQAGHHLNRGRFARPVWSQEAKKLAATYRQIKVAYRNLLSKVVFFFQAEDGIRYRLFAIWHPMSIIATLRYTRRRRR